MTMRRERPPGGDALRSAATKILKDALDRGDKIIGLTGERPGSGVSMLATALADAGRSAALSTLLIKADSEPAPDANEPAQDDAALLDTGTHQAEDDAPEAEKETLASKPQERSWQRLEIRNPTEFDAVRVKESFKSQAAQFDLIIVDLPPICWNGSEPYATTLKFGSGCDALYLICLAGIANQSSLSYIANLSSVASLPLKGLILNDYKLFGAKLTPRR